MQTGILKKIDVLVEMTESTANADTLKAELKEIEIEIEELKEELVLLRDSRESEKYFKISEKQVDENIKVSLEAKIRKQEKAIRKLQKEIDSVVVEESNYHNRIAKLKEEIALSNEYISIINKRIFNISEGNTKEYYENVLKDETEKINNLTTSLETLESKDKETLENLNYLNLAMEEMNNKLSDEKARLLETKNNLGGPSSYIDEELKEQDDKHISELQKKIADLEKRRLEIITDPAIIASEAKQLLVEDNRSSALVKIQELVTIVKSKPYMDIPSSNELTAMLEEEEEIATSARDEFASLIDTKNYSSGDTEVIEERINFLNSEISSLEERIRLAKEEITNIDNVQFKNIVNHLSNTIEVYNQLQKELGEYKIIIETENEDKTPKRRAILASAFDRKQKELVDVANIIEHYKEDQKVLINKAFVLETNEIKNYEQEIEKKKQEIREMEFLLETASKAKDVLAIENDKQKLKDLDTAVKNIKHRQKYGQTPSEIYDEIEIYLGTADLDSYKYEEKSNKSPIFTSYTPIEPQEVFEELPSLEENELSAENLEKEESIENLEVNEENNFVIGEYNNTLSTSENQNENQ